MILLTVRAASLDATGWHTTLRKGVGWIVLLKLPCLVARATSGSGLRRETRGSEREEAKACYTQTYGKAQTRKQDANAIGEDGRELADPATASTHEHELQRDELESRIATQ
jgi:hypothetical protein